MTIDEIYKNEEISVRSYNVCKYNGLNSTEDLQAYYLKYNSFENLRNCGRRSNEELIEICKNHQSNICDGNKIELQTFSLERTIYSLTKSQRENIDNFIIDNLKNLSVRSRNAIYSYLNGNLQIENLYKKKILSNTFNLNSIKNIGAKCIPELETYITIVKNNILKDSEKKEILNCIVSEPLEDIIANLTRIEREVINNFILVNTNSLSVRSKNAISQFLNHNFSVRNFVEKILLDKYFKVRDLENVGKKSIPELEIYISIVNDFIRDVNEANDEKQLISLKNNFLIQRNFSISKIPSEISQSESIFQLTDFLLKNNTIFNENHNLIIQKALKIYQNEKEQTLDQIALENKLSRERVRQVRKNCINELFEKLSFIKNFNDDLFQNYGIDLSSNLIEVKENLVTKINTINKTNFSKEFISYILAVYLSENFLVIGNIEDILQPKYFNNRTRHNWNNFYVVNREFSKVDFISFANDVNERLNERIEETYSFNFKSYLSRFINDFDIEIIERAFPIAEKITNDEFALYLDLNDNIVFKRNTIKQAFEYSYEALEKLGKASKIEEITQKIVELHPYYETDENKVRASMKRNNGFIPIGRSSTYGLKKWEIEVEDFKGGTIKDIVIAYLDKNNNPIHIYEILEEIHRYREETNAKNVITNLKLDPQKQFVIFNQSFIGLNKKDYDSNLTDLPKFLGKSITNYVRQNYNVNVYLLNQHYSNLLDISNENMNYILQQLIDNNFIYINEKKMLTV